MTRTFLSLGSNLGDRLSYLRAAVAALDRGPHMRVLGTSRVYETDPVEVEDEQPNYLNCVVELECGVGAIECLRYCQGIEAALGREKKGEKAPRTLDIDVLLFGEECLTTPDLHLPHGGITRAFNLQGLEDLDEDLDIPAHGKVNSLLKQADESGIRKFAR